MRMFLKVAGVFAVASTTAAVVWLGGKEAPAITAEHAESLETLPGADGCPEGADEGGMGPSMKRLPEGFCIDTTEVTRAQYETWLESADPTEETGACADNEAFEPSCNWPPGNDGAKPVVCVDWCDANAFCEAAGKRLCGSVADGGAYDFDDYANPAISEWQAACSSGGEHEYAHGGTVETLSCRGGDAEDYTTWGIVDAGSLADCQSPESAYAGVYDLSGNVAEWENSCVGTGSDDACRFRGGSYQHQGVGLRCAMARTLKWPRMNRVDSIGIRCCAD